MASFEQVSADLPEQHAALPSLLSAVDDLEEQQDAADLPQASFPPLSAVFEEQHAAPLDLSSLPLLFVALSAAVAALPPSATLFALEPASLVCATSVVVLSLVLAVV